MTTLERDEMAFVLETLRSDETLDLGGLGIWFLSLSLWLHLSADNEFADLYFITLVSPCLLALSHLTSRHRGFGFDSHHHP